MFRTYADTVRKPIDIEKLETEPRTKKSISDVYKCDLCDEAWLTETDVDIHRKKEHLTEIISSIRDEKEHFCLICVRAQGSAENVISHIKSDHLLSSPTAQRVERDIFICDQCENIFFNKRLLITHIQYLHRDKSNIDLVIPCPKCHKSFKSHKMWFHLNFHQLNINTTCPICLVGCAVKSQRTEHLASHPGYYHCNDCNLFTNKKQCFDEHIESHKKRIPHKVDGDLRRFFAPRAAVVPWHYRMESRIKGLQLYDLSICILCREICASAEEKRQHMLVDHAPDKEVKQKPMCVCGEEFFNMVLLKHHVFKLKGNHRVLGESAMHSQSVRDLSDNALPMECELFSVQDLGPIEDEVIVTNSI